MAFDLSMEAIKNITVRFSKTVYFLWLGAAASLKEKYIYYEVFNEAIFKWNANRFISSIGPWTRVFLYPWNNTR